MRKHTIETEDYFAGYNQSIDDLKNHPDAIRLDKLCYIALELNPDGKELLKELEARYVYPPLSHMNAKNFSEQCIYFEGFKEAIRVIRRCVENHRNRVQYNLEESKNA